eukprot:TRINITY_DN4570_c0_g1_i1.p1 TRINITY_DN4570_c0_g1~~TRINITY_DN4570_c0_g1_i1.p1  ORF type:complete len:240 (+),score=37.92 TRINITY_DN4570_c0_g1_i1:32-751(+)
MDGLQDDHIELLVKYLRFVRFKRAQHVKDVGAAFEEVIESRLTETTFTNDEVADMLTGLSIVVSGDIESELMHFSHVNVLMLRQLIKQAETWKLNFKLDVDSLEDRKELEQIAKFEQDRFAMGAASVQRLEPLNDGAGTALMSSEIDKLRAENDALRERCEAAEAKAMEAWKEKEDAKEQAGKLEAKLHRLEKEGADSLGSSDKVTMLEVSCWLHSSVMEWLNVGRFVKVSKRSGAGTR